MSAFSGIEEDALSFNYSDSDTVFTTDSSVINLANFSTTPKPTVTTSINFLPLGLALILLCVLGLVGNVLCAVVLARPKMKSSYSTLTLALTFYDTVYLLTKLLRYGLQSMFLYSETAIWYTDIFYPILGPFMRAITFTSHTGSTYFTMAVAMDRYLSVCWPYQARVFCTRKRALSTIAALFVFSTVYNLPRWWEFHTEVNYSEKDDDGNIRTTYYKMAQSPLRHNADYKKYYIFWSYFFIMFFIPFTSLSVFNYLIWRAIRMSAKKREKLTSSQKRDTSFAMMLLSVVVVFLVCSFDYLVLDLMDFSGNSYPPFWDHLGNFLLTLNSAVNFIIYCAFGNKFREEFLLFCKDVACWNTKKPAQSKSGGKSTCNVAADHTSNVTSRITEYTT